MLGGDVDAAVGYGGNGEAKTVAGSVTGEILCGIIEFVGDIGGIVGEENGGLIRAIPDFGGENPDDAIFGAIRGNSRRAGVVDVCSALGNGLRGQAAILQRVIPQIIVHEEVEDMAVPVSGSAEGLRACGNDLHGVAVIGGVEMTEIVAVEFVELRGLPGGEQDRKSTRLNSSHL